MSTAERDKFLSRYELLLKIFSVIFEVICLVISIILLANSEENQANLIVGLVFLLAMPLLIWLMYSLSMVLISFFYDVKMIRNRLCTIEERSRNSHKEPTNGEKTTSSQPSMQGNVEEKTEVDDSEIDKIISILSQKRKNK